jgi:hypothetical protein
MRPRTPRRRRAARALTTLGAAGLALGLTACSGAGNPTAAAVVEGRVISERDVQTVVAELPLEVTGGAQVAPSQIVSVLMVSEIVEDVAREFTGVTGRDEARELLQAVDTDADREPFDYSDATLDAIAVNVMLNNIQQTDVAAPVLEERLQELQSGGDVQMNPRYGRVGEDGSLQFSNFSHDWLPSADGQPAEPETSED